MSSDTPLVLVVDDNEMNRDMLARRLQRQNCEVVMAENGAVALDAVKNRNFDLVLLDIMMPGISGYEVLEKLKADEATRHIPVIMISAVDDLDSVVKCIEMGAEDYLFKPFNPVLLKARVGASLSRRPSANAPSGDSKSSVQRIEKIRADLAVLDSSNLSDDQKDAIVRIKAHVDSLATFLK